MTCEAAIRPPRRKARELVGNFLWLSAERVLDMFVAVAVTVLMARYLGPAQYGELAFLVGLAAIFGAIARAGIDQVVVRDLVRSAERKDELLGTAGVIKFAAGAIAAGLMLAVVCLTARAEPDRIPFATILAVTLLIQALDVPEMLFSSRTQSRYPVMARSLARIIMALARTGLIYLAAPLLAFVGAAAFEPLLIVAMILIVYRRQGNSLRALGFDPTLAASLLRRGFPLMISGIAVLVMMRIDLVMLEQFRGSAAVGIFAGATRIADMCCFLATGVMTSVTPTLIAIGTESRASYDAFLARLYQGLALVMVLVCLFFTIFAGSFFDLLLGPSYAGAADVLRIYIWSSVFISLGVVQGQWLVNEGYNLFMFYRAVSGAVINILANLLLIPAYGAEGAAISTCIAQFASSILSNLFYDAATRRMFVLQAKALVGANLPTLWPSRQSVNAGP
jgi:PST family polysaccharide transporter